MKKLLSSILAVVVCAGIHAEDLKEAVKITVPETVESGSPIIIQLKNIPDGYNFHSYLFHAFLPYVPSGLEKGADVYVRRQKNRNDTCYIFGPLKIDRAYYIQAQDMWQRDFTLKFKSDNWPCGDYQAAVNLSFLDKNRKQHIVKKEIVFSIVEKRSEKK